MICVRDKPATLLKNCPGLCREVGVMEFWLYWGRWGAAVLIRFQYHVLTTCAQLNFT